jgi:DNA polymerase III subunit delta'
MGEIKYGIDSHPARVIRDAIDNNRISQTLLLYGDNIKQLEDVAHDFAAQILGSSGDIKKHPDLFTLTPSGKARVIKIGEDSSDQNTVRSFLHNINLTPRQGSRKVGIIMEVDRLNKSSSNAFLKTLEEPPNDTTLILLTSHPYDLLETIRSRCFILKIPTHKSSIELSEWKEWLNDYEVWLKKLLSEKKTKNDNTHLIMAIYGLASRFSYLLDKLHEEEWSSIKDQLQEGLIDEQIDAMTSGNEKGIRKTMLTEIEVKTRNTALQEETIKQASIAGKLSEAINTLERCVGLMELNLKTEAALEYFLLKSLRIWARA